MSFEVSRASAADAIDVASILQQASEFKASQGDNLWGPEPFTTEEAAALIGGGDMYLARIDDAPAAVMKLSQSDPRMWGEEQGNDEQALYVHRLSVGEDFRGQNLGKTMMKWAFYQARMAGKPLLRLDCPYDNPALLAYYTRQGFTEVRREDRHASGGRNPNNPVYRVSLLQKIIEQ